MKIVQPREFRDNLKKYLNIAEEEGLIIHRGTKGKDLVVKPLEENI